MDPFTLILQIVFYSVVFGAYVALLTDNNDQDDDDDQDGGILQPCYVTNR